MTHTDLKPCPFCGSDQVTMSKAWASDSVVWVAICKACSASVDHEDEASAAKAWNTRAPDTAPSQSADLIAELERNATWRDDRYQCVTSPDLLRRAATALRAAEANVMMWKVAMAQAEETTAKVASAYIDDARRWQFDGPGVEIARRALGGSNDPTT